MIDYSLKSYKEVLKTADDYANLLSDTLQCFEKMDGTKLTLIRNKEEYDNDYTKNWIVAYKGNIIFDTEFAFLKSGFQSQDILRHSIGTSQYFIVHDYLRENHPNFKDIPKNTEFLIEFIQRKKTLTRQYDKYHKLFLIGIAENVTYRIDEGRVTSVGEMILAIENLDWVRRMNLNCPQMIYNSYWPEHLDWNAFKRYFLTQMESILGGRMEGIVIYSPKFSEPFKLVQEDQYNKEVRRQIKQQWEGTEEEEKEYWKLIIEQTKIIAFNVAENFDHPEDYRLLLEKVSKVIYSKDFSNIPHPVLRNINKQDDVFLSVKLLLLTPYLFLPKNTRSVGMIALAGKPIHRGHWKLIQKALFENTEIILFVSTKDREFITGKTMLKIWSLLENYLKNSVSWKKYHLKFSDSPVLEMQREIKFLEINGIRPKVNVYADADDIESYKKNIKETFVEFIGVNRRDTTDISGTRMRDIIKNIVDSAGLNKEYTESQRDIFMNFLPDLSFQDKLIMTAFLLDDYVQFLSTQLIDKYIEEHK